MLSHSRLARNVRYMSIHDKFCQEEKRLPVRARRSAKNEKTRQSHSALYASRQGSCDTQNHPSICCLEQRLGRSLRRRLSLCSLPVPKQVGGSLGSFRSVAQTYRCGTWQTARRVICFLFPGSSGFMPRRCCDSDSSQMSVRRDRRLVSKPLACGPPRA